VSNVCGKRVWLWGAQKKVRKFSISYMGGEL